MIVPSSPLHNVRGAAQPGRAGRRRSRGDARVVRHPAYVVIPMGGTGSLHQHRWGEAAEAGNSSAHLEQADDQVRRAGRGRGHQTRPAFSEESLPNLLERRPFGPRRSGWSESYRPEPLGRREVGHLCGSGEAPQIPREGPMRWHSQLGQHAVPLRPHRLLAVGQIEALDHLAALPATVRWVSRRRERVRPGRDMSPPGPGQAQPVDGEARPPTRRQGTRARRPRS